MTKMDIGGYEVEGVPEGFGDDVELTDESSADEDVEYIDEEVTVELTDEDGETIEFQLVYSTTVDERQFAVLFPADIADGDEVEAVIFEIEDEETLCSVDDDDLVQRVFEKFQRDNADRFNFV